MFKSNSVKIFLESFGNFINAIVKMNNISCLKLTRQLISSKSLRLNF